MDVRVWVGCSAHYNSGALIGDWVDAKDAADWECPRKNPTDIYINCEETWCFDHEIPGVSGELSPSEASAWGAIFAELEDDECEPFAIWLRYGYRVNDVKVEDFRDQYLGAHDSERDFAHHMAEECLEMDSWPKVAQDYFDYEAYANDLFIDGYTYEDGHVFANR